MPSSTFRVSVWHISPNFVHTRLSVIILERLGQIYDFGVKSLEMLSTSFRSAARAAAIRRLLSGACRPALATCAPSRGIKLFDRLIPEDDPETKQRKAQEREILTKKMSRSVIGEMAAAQKEKVCAARQAHQVNPRRCSALAAAVTCHPLSHHAHVLQMFTASAALEPTTSARPFPECEVSDLAGSGLKFDPTGEFRSHKATLVTVAFQAYGQHQLEPWLTQFVERASPCNILQEGPSVASSPALLNVVYLHGWFFKLFNTMFMNNVAGGLPAGLADYSGVAFSNDEKETDVRRWPLYAVGSCNNADCPMSADVHCAPELLTACCRCVDVNSSLAAPPVPPCPCSSS